MTPTFEEGKMFSLVQSYICYIFSEQKRIKFYFKSRLPLYLFFSNLNIYNNSCLHRDPLYKEKEILECHIKNNIHNSQAIWEQNLISSSGRGNKNRVQTLSDISNEHTLSIKRLMWKDKQWFLHRLVTTLRRSENYSLI